MEFPICTWSNPFSSAVRSFVSLIIKSGPIWLVSLYGSSLQAQKAALWYHRPENQHGHNNYLCLEYIIACVNILCLLTLFANLTMECVLSIASAWWNGKEPFCGECSVFVLQQGKGGIGCCAYCSALQMLQLPVGRSETPLPQQGIPEASELPSSWHSQSKWIRSQCNWAPRQ